MPEWGPRERRKSPARYARGHKPSLSHREAAFFISVCVLFAQDTYPQNETPTRAVFSFSSALGAGADRRAKAVRAGLRRVHPPRARQRGGAHRPGRGQWQAESGCAPAVHPPERGKGEAHIAPSEARGRPRAAARLLCTPPERGKGEAHIAPSEARGRPRAAARLLLPP
jgi:hypothetical protein